MVRPAFPGSHDILRHELPNGITVLVRENHQSQSVVISGTMQAGAIFDPPEKQGLVEFTASALTRGTTRYDFNTLHEALEGIGASIHTSGGMHHVHFDGKSLAEDLPELTKMLGEVLRRPTFPENQVERLRGEILTSLKMWQQNTRYMAGRLFRKMAYPPEHPYHRGSTGEIDTISAIQLDDLHRYHQQQFGPHNMIIVIVGSANAEAAIAEVGHVFGDWVNPQQQGLPAIPDAPAIRELRQQTYEIAGKSQADIVLGVPGPSRFAADYQAARLANNIFGLFGMFGRLGKEIRENQGLAYYSYSQMSGGPGPGSWRVMAGVDPGNVQQAITSIRKEIRRMIDEPLDADELEDNKSNLTGVLPLQLETNEGMATMIYNMERYNLGLDYLYHYADEINALEAGQVQQAMARYWSPDAFALAVAGPAWKAN
jgi:zinc protease